MLEKGVLQEKVKRQLRSGDARGSTGATVGLPRALDGLLTGTQRESGRLRLFLDLQYMMFGVGFGLALRDHIKELSIVLQGYRKSSDLYQSLRKQKVIQQHRRKSIF